MSAHQRSFTGSGYVQAVPDIPPITCAECNRSLPPATTVCPVCGADRGLAGAAYPAQNYERFKWVWAQEIGNANAKHVLHALVSHDGPGSRGIFPSVDRLATMTELHRTSVIRALRYLREHGWIERHKVRRRGRQASSVYIVQQPELIAAEYLRVQSSGERP